MCPRLPHLQTERPSTQRALVAQNATRSCTLYNRLGPTYHALILDDFPSKLLTTPCSSEAIKLGGYLLAGSL